MPRTTFYFIRHCDHDLLGKVMAGRMPGVPLSTKGFAEADCIPARMQDVPLSAIYASPLERAQQTAQPLAREFGLEVNTSDALNEVNFGEWTGRNINELHSDPMWQAWNQHRSCARPPGGEMIVEVQNRMATKIEALRAAHPDQHVALVSHSDTIRAALTYYLGMGADLLLRLEVSPGSVSVLRLGDGPPQVLCVNNTATLAFL